MTTRTITALTPQQRRRHRINVFLDNAFAFGLPDILAAPLRVGQILTEQEIAVLQAANAEEDAFDRALRFLEYRARSEVEVRDYLDRKEAPQAAIDSVIERLRQLGYLDDAAFARGWVASRSTSRPRGTRALKHELRSKGVDVQLIEDALVDFPSDEAAYEAVRRSAERWRELDARLFRQKVATFLARRGFDYDVTRRTATRLLEEFAKTGVDDPTLD